MDMNLDFIKEFVLAAPFHITVKDNAGKYLACSYNAAKYFNLSSAHEIIGKTIYDLTEHSIADKVSKLDEEALSTQQKLTVKENLVKAGNLSVVVSIIRMPFHDVASKILRLITIYQEEIDIACFYQQIETSTKELEKLKKANAELTEQLRNLDEIIALMPGNVYWKNREGVYLGCNENNAISHGFNSRKEYVGKKIHDFVSKEGADKIHEVDELVMSSNKELFLEETVPERGLFYLTRKVPLRDSHGRVNGLVGISMDITERKQYEEELKAANQMKMDFIHNMEHDIRTPCAGIYYLANDLSKNETDSAKKELLSYLAAASKELLDFCNGILDFSNTEYGNRPIVSKKFELKKLVDSVIAMEMPAARNKNLDLLFDYDTVIPPVILGDSYRVQRILINLISNAIKFTQTGYVKVSFQGIQQEKNILLLKIIVEDTGLGIPKEKQTYIYEAFAKGMPSNKGIHKGLGLGLRVVKQFMNEMEGEIDVVSEAGKGCKFICVLPFKLPLLNEVINLED